MIKALVFFVLVSCSISRFHESSDLNSISSSSNFKYIAPDVNYSFKRETKKQNKKLVTRSRLFSKSNQVLEKTVTVSKIGVLNGEVSTLPEVSQFNVWFNKSEYFSQIKINREQRQLEVLSKGPEEKNNFEKSFPLPSGKYFCFFSQIPECLKAQKLLLKAVNKNVSFFVIWDNYPYQTELYDGLGEEPFTQVSLSLDKHNKKGLKYSIDLGNQIIIYSFDTNLKLNGFFWVTQGISAELVNKE